MRRIPFVRLLTRIGSVLMLVGAVAAPKKW